MPPVEARPFRGHKAPGSPDLHRTPPPSRATLMDILRDHALYLPRRQFFGAGVSSAVGWAALTSLLGEAQGAAAPRDLTRGPKLPGLAHHAPKAKHVIYLH